MKALLLSLILSGPLLAGAAQAGPAADAIFAEDIFGAVPAGEVMTYSHVRHGAAVPDFQPVIEGSIVLMAGAATAEGRSLSVVIKADGRQTELSDFPASGGNPVLMVFLESTVRSMAAISGGSPFYIRNRIKDAFRSGGTLVEVEHAFGGRQIMAQEVTFQPFLTDPNRARMGAFADLTLRFVVSDGVPGHFLLLTADTPEPGSGFHEAITILDGGAE